MIENIFRYIVNSFRNAERLFAVDVPHLFIINTIRHILQECAFHIIKKFRDHVFISNMYSICSLM